MPTDPKTGRPVAGPADDATRKRLLKERMAEREPANLYAKKPAPKSELKQMTLNPIKNIKQRKSKLDQAIEDSGG